MSATIINKMLVRAVYDNNVDRVKELILMGADPNYSYTRNGQSTSLIKACVQNRFTSILRILLENGVYIKPSVKNSLLRSLSQSEKELISIMESMESADVLQSKEV